MTVVDGHQGVFHCILRALKSLLHWPLNSPYDARKRAAMRPRDLSDEHPMQASIITPGLLLSSCQVEQSFETLQKLGVTHILQVGTRLRPSHPDRGFTYLSLELYDADENDLMALLPTCFEFLQQAHAQKGVVLVHCMAGISRSASVVIAYMMWSRKLSYVDARNKVWDARPWIFPNMGFLLQLKELEKLRNSDKVKWGNTASLSAYLQQHWKPWDLTRYLEAKQEMNDAVDKGWAADDLWFTH